ncbi:hypothetical protein C5F44_08740 [Fuscovulum blasticum DSM 2131]|uniref:Uncharacterized protein n=1 Tax=Fuscovulum blasticum DSM 2131 TaxID=1188250 RepID=A0A2T4J9F5_FUSBL|nr:hypothetical protein C5F44_08740 [Fuscovulum blasticum DSM 2131]
MFVSSVDSSDRGRYFVLKRENVGTFLDFESVMKRLAEIAASGPPELRVRAMELLAMANMERH